MSRKRILIVEDLPTLAIAYAAQLERAGFEPVTVETGAQALRALADEGQFAAMLLDLQLPDVDGLQLLRDNTELLGRLPVVVATADASLTRAIEAMRLGAFDFLVKPLAGPRLVSVVTSAVETGQVPQTAPAPTPLSRSTAAPSPKTCWNPNCSAI